MIRQDQLGSPPFDACLADGTFLMESTVPSPPGARRTARVMRVRLDGTVVNQVGDFSFAPFDMVTQSEGTLLAAQQRIYIGDAQTSEVRVYTPEGRLSRIIRSNDPPVRITNAEAEARMRSSIPRNTPTGQVEARMDRMRALPHAQNWPAYRRVLVDPRGYVWMQDYARTYPSPDGWTAFDAEGRMVGRLVIPAPETGKRRMDIITFGMNEVLVRRIDDDGAAHLTLFPIERLQR
jgi:hypothetical protein